MEKAVQGISKVRKVSDIVRYVKAFVHGFESFMASLEGSKPNESK